MIGTSTVSMKPKDKATRRQTTTEGKTMSVKKIKSVVHLMYCCTLILLVLSCHWPLGQRLSTNDKALDIIFVS